ncbi:TetR/AcrR family transcriptional regulator [Clostridium saccharobutylicum]|uniref:Transcriptional regulator, TetR family n=1 Tax=Clostridium saccharobutylicum DSM 13864 TaxID=1345695 RepID=U5MRX4_CLOSA|nr:TetR/AcrR family transcriptional regulator [Clostridium saccharobutylicum]AGX42192.1 transcriptional regulator, TetR family [Clostridium saccharobutylicum DSM 13864]AQR89472.1 putative HTH-type transcriptional regulator YttP [Clostridium saccharobutylicum]AQR99374.1 putative HTH-type transcriptional regulator YttP [Clostridium saccharobutylicum]AQS09105.1 putative HTH-type transcriptional regulator YttP [Clostridium saccharobutylicum]AQS13360.1 putative HTH-type transcriptional regulator Yt
MSGNLKKQIIEKAIELFNEKGYESVTMRDISGALQISVGNLTYHFKKKDDILYAIMIEQYNDHKNRNYSTNISLQDFNSLLVEIMDHQLKYSFYFNNVVEMGKKYQEISKLQVKGKIYFNTLVKGIIQNFVDNGWMKKEQYEGMYDNLSFAIFSIIMFWPQQNSLKDDELSHNKNLLSIIWSVLIPNLTDKGINDLHYNL